MKKAWNKLGRWDKILMTLVVSAGVILYWRGIWEISERIFPPVGSLFAGMLILVATGYLTTKELI